VTLGQWFSRAKSFFRKMRKSESQTSSGGDQILSSEIITTNDWYEEVDPTVSLTQGDLVFECPVPIWDSSKFEVDKDVTKDVLLAARKVVKADVVVMSQACDLEHGKVQDVILCQHISLSDYKIEWERIRKASGVGIGAKAWESECKRLNDGLVWHKALLNSDPNIGLEHRVVDFYNVYTLPKPFLEKLIINADKKRPRLLPPYREHLSQGFARFFMRVGLPTPVNKAW
jgi:hypothetical protein